MTSAPGPMPPTVGAPPPPVATAPRRARLAVLAGGVLVAGVAIGVAAGLATRGGTARPPAAPGTAASSDPAVARARAQYQQAIAAAGQSAGFHYVAVSTGGPNGQTIVGDAAKDTGTQAITLDSTFGHEQFTLVLTGGVVYFQGNAAAAQDQLGVPASKTSSVAGTWVSVAAADGPYAVLAPGITVSDQAQEMLLVPTSTSRASASGGVTVDRILGTVAGAQGGAGGTAQLDVATDTHLPVSEVSTARANGVTLTSTTTFSAWGKAVAVTAPAAPVAWSTLGASEPPGGYGGGGSSASPSATPGV